MSPETLSENTTVETPEPRNAPWKPGQSGNPAGKPPGPNKAPRLLREAILVAADLAGQRIQRREMSKLVKQHGEAIPERKLAMVQDANGLVRYLLHLAEKEPRSFATMLGRVLPLQVEGTIEVRNNPLADLMQTINGTSRTK